MCKILGGQTKSIMVFFVLANILALKVLTDDGYFIEILVPANFTFRMPALQVNDINEH